MPLAYRTNYKTPNFFTKLFDIKSKVYSWFGVTAKRKKFNYYQVPKRVIEAVKQHGYLDNDNLVEYWFNHRSSLLTTYFNNTIDDEIIQFDRTHRWLTEIGKACKEQLLIFINDHKIHEHKKIQGVGTKRFINIENFSFEFKGERHDLATFNRAIKLSFNNNKLDLSGINLSNISFRNTYLHDVDFSYSMLYDCNFTDCWLTALNFDVANIKCCKFSSCKFAGKTKLRFTNFYGCQFAHIIFSTDNVDRTMRINKVQYRYLAGSVFDKVFGSMNNDINLDNVFRRYIHTSFLDCDTSALVNPDKIAFKRYVDWYQYTLFELGAGYANKTLVEKTFLFCSILFTKSWTSYGALAVTGFITSFIFGTIFYLSPPSSFTGLDDSFITSFYYSVVTFTTLGYGDISPLTSWGRIIVMIEVILGYITLGSFVFLIGHKANDRY
ncbi:MAG: hypothetical protein ACJAXJ_003375 [Colwellia sp.]|jgi:hypothetical protein